MIAASSISPRSSTVLRARRSQFSNRAVWGWRTSPPRPTFTNGWLRSLFLHRHLGVGIAPCTQLQATANPAQPFGGIGSAFFAANAATGALLHAIGLNRPLGFFNQSLWNDRSFWSSFRD